MILDANAPVPDKLGEVEDAGHDIQADPSLPDTDGVRFLVILESSIN